MTINSISMGMNGTMWGAYVQKLSEATKAKLMELHIPFDDKMTEAQARVLISQAEARRNNQNLSQNQSKTPQDNLFEQAKKLAQKLGLSVDENIKFEELLTNIETALFDKIEENSNNEQMLFELKNCSRELAMIQSAASGQKTVNATNQALMMSLEMLGEYNKNFLNKN